MKERSAAVIGALVLLIIILPLGFLVHASPRFPGSLSGSLIGITGALLMISSLAYLPVKRIPWLHDRVTKRIPARTMLALHIYAGVLGALLGLIHAAHKFNSPLGVSLTGTMIMVVLSGYVGRYFLGQVARAVRGRKSELAELRRAFASRASVREGESEKRIASSGKTHWLRAFLVPDVPVGPREQDRSASDLAGAIADTEYAIRSEEVVNRALGHWVVLHIILAVVLTLLLLLHIWSGLYYGLRWL